MAFNVLAQADSALVNEAKAAIFSLHKNYMVTPHLTLIPEGGVF